MVLRPRRDSVNVTWSRMWVRTQTRTTFSGTRGRSAGLLDSSVFSSVSGSILTFFLESFGSFFDVYLRTRLARRFRTSSFFTIFDLFARLTCSPALLSQQTHKIRPSHSKEKVPPPTSTSNKLRISPRKAGRWRFILVTWVRRLWSRIWIRRLIRLTSRSFRLSSFLFLYPTTLLVNSRHAPTRTSQGFLSESPSLPVALSTLPTPIPTTTPHKGVAFIGPPASVLQLFGDKQAAKELAVKAGVPVVPGTNGAITTPSEAVAFFKSLDTKDKVYAGVMVKAVYGGGGRGMRAVTDVSGLEEAVRRCQSEAKASFGRDEV